mmetsp:Transcript_10222/g.14269  ORF Transcript_10222/g.14269 Transcript_10222/m.14269 type:complete len:236 (-) Transcript_10222:144-851(-)
MQMCGHVGKGQVQAARYYNLRRVAVLAIAHEGGIIDGPLDNFVGRCFLTYDADVVLDRLLSEREVLSDEYADANARDVEAIEEGVRLFHFFEGVAHIFFLPRRRSQFVRPPCHLHENAGVSVVYILHNGSKARLLAGRADVARHRYELLEAGGVEVLDRHDGLHVLEQRHLLQVQDAVRQPDGQLVPKKAGHLHQHSLRGHLVVFLPRSVAVRFVQELAAPCSHQSLQRRRRLRL